MLGGKFTVVEAVAAIGIREVMAERGRTEGLLYHPHGL